MLHGPKPVAQREHGKPRQDRVGNQEMPRRVVGKILSGEHALTELSQHAGICRVVLNILKFIHESDDLTRDSPIVKRSGLEGIMPGDDGQAENENCGRWQPDECAQEHHRSADRPDHLRKEKGRVPLEEPQAVEERMFEQYQPESAREEKHRQLPARHAARAGEKCPGPGQEHERRRTEVRDPARVVQERGRGRQIQFRGDLEIAKIVARVIEGHEDHDQPAQNVDRIKPPGTRRMRDARPR